MSSLVLSIPTAPAPAHAASGASSSAPRARDAQSPTDTEAFGAALARTRENRSRQAQDKAEPAADAPPARRRGLTGSSQREETSPADLLAMAMLTPVFQTQATALQQQNASASPGSDAAVRTALEGMATANELPAATDAAQGDAQPHAQPGAAADKTAATQAAQASAAELQDKDEKSAKVKSDAQQALPDAKAAAQALPASTATAAQVPTQAAGAAASSTASASPTAAAASSKPSTDAAALPLQAARDAAPEHDNIDTASDTPAQLPGAFSFKAALAEAANAQAPAPAQPVPRFSVPTPVGSDGWGADVGTQMIRMGTDGHHVAELSLNPAGLGPLKVTLTLGDNLAQAQFVSAHESVRRALEAALPQLRDTLASQGIQLGQASVDAGARQQQQQAFADQDQRNFEASARAAQRDLRQAAGGQAVDAQPMRAATRGRAASGIDTFA
ncbi:MAG: flagellar hook-length control protein FliK [Proteobacteria bacterium]|nr:flagellar hook-length control protein FliK [Pseudomonadota bacterium]